MLDFFFGLFSNDLGIDLGTANTLVFVRGKGILIREPSVIALQKKTKDILAIGEEARAMIGKTPPNIIAIRPLRDGVISDFDATRQMLQYFIHRAHQAPSLIPKVPRPRIVIGIPSSVTEVERRAVSDAALNAGARQVFLVEEPMAAAIGAGLPVSAPDGSMIVDIGGGTTEIAVISLGGIVTVKSLRLAGDKMDQAVGEYTRSKFFLLLGEKMAEEVKIAVGNAYPLTKVNNPNNPDNPSNSNNPNNSSNPSNTDNPDNLNNREIRRTVMRGRDLKTGLPRSMEVTETEIREALDLPLQSIAEAVKETVEDTPPELVSDIIQHGITLCGGGSQIPGLADLIAERTKITVRVAKDPMTCVVRGTGILLDKPKLLDRVKVA